MKLLVLTRQFGSYTGATVSTIELLKRISKDFDKVTVLTFRDDNTKIDNVKIDHIGNLFNIKKKILEVTEGNSDWIGYSDDHLGWIFKKSKIPYVHTYHGNWPDIKYQDWKMFIKSFVFIPMYKKTIRNADVIVNVSEYMERKFTRKVSTTKSVVIYNGIKQPIINKKNSKSNNFLMVGNVDKRKYKHAIKIFNRLNIIGISNIKIDIYGKIIDKNIANKLSKFRFVSLKGKQKRINYNNYKKLLCCSSSENLPVSVVESLLNNVPVVSFNVGGINEVVYPDSGFLCDLGDYDQFVKYMFSTNKFEFNRFNSVREKFDWDYVSRKYKLLFYKVGEN